MRPAIPKAVRKRVLARFDGRCGYCGKPDSARHVDHVWPVYRGGTDDEENLMPACRTCNIRKATHTVEEFRHEVAMQPQRLEHIAGFRIALALGLLEVRDVPVKFYFEGQQ